MRASGGMAGVNSSGTLSRAQGDGHVVEVVSADSPLTTISQMNYGVQCPETAIHRPAMTVASS